MMMPGGLEVVQQRWSDGEGQGRDFGVSGIKL